MTEITTADGYLIDNASRTIQLDGNETAEFVFTNTKKPTMEIVKYDPNTGRYLAGATFRIARIEDGSHYLDRVTDTQGRITIDNLDPGIYSVQEIDAPAGYVLNKTEYHVELFPGKTSELVVNNEKKPDLKIIKTDAITGKPVSGVTVTVKKVDSSTLLTETTDRNGEILIEQLDPGVYEVWEQSVPDDYLIDETHQHITLFPNKMGVVQFQNYPKPSVTVKKIDSTLTHDYRAMTAELETLRLSKVTNSSAYLAVQDKWTEAIYQSYLRILNEEQQAKYLKSGAAKAKKARDKRAAKAQAAEPKKP